MSDLHQDSELVCPGLCTHEWSAVKLCRHTAMQRAVLDSGRRDASRGRFSESPNRRDRWGGGEAVAALPA